MKKGLKAFLLFVVASCINWAVDAQSRSTTKQITLFGTISSAAGTEEMAGLPIFYKGGEYTVAADKENEIKKIQLI